MNITIYIIIITSILSIIGFNNRELFYKFQFNPYNIAHRNQQYRFLTHAFLHADWMHLLFNMFALFFFGPLVEGYLDAYFENKGALYFVLLYTGGIAFAALPSFKKYKNSPAYNSIGASGAVSAVLFASIIFNPMNRICLYGILCFPGILWGVAYLAYSYYMSKKENDLINHDAHFAGAVFGILLILTLKPSLFLIFINQIIAAF